MKKILLLSCLLLLTSCHSQMTYPVMDKPVIDKPSMDKPIVDKVVPSDQQRKTDALECKMLAADFKSKSISGGSPSFGIFGLVKHKKEMNAATKAANEFYIECMEERGYKEE